MKQNASSCKSQVMNLSFSPTTCFTDLNMTAQRLCGSLHLWVLVILMILLYSCVFWLSPCLCILVALMSHFSHALLFLLPAFVPFPLSRRSAPPQLLSPVPHFLINPLCVCSSSWLPACSFWTFVCHGLLSFCFTWYFSVFICSPAELWCFEEWGVFWVCILELSLDLLCFCLFCLPSPLLYLAHKSVWCLC